MMWIYLNGEFIRKEDARISVLDHGFLYGDGVYETLRAYAGRYLLLPQHVARLHRSAALIGLTIPLSERDWPDLLRAALERNGLAQPAPGSAAAGTGSPPDAYVRVTVSRGEGDIGLDPALCPRPTVVIIAKPLPAHPARLYAEGVRLKLVSVRRNSTAALPPRIKSLNFLNNILAKREASLADAFDALMLNGDGVLTECTASNLFFARGGRLYTPSEACGILDGVTRGIVLQLCREEGLSVEEGAYPPARLLEADECFLTNTSMELMPVAEVDGHRIGPGRPGPLTTRLHDRFRKNLPRFLS